MKNVLLLLLVIVTLQNIKAQAPIITTFSPTSGPIGTSVIITGSGFDVTPANNVVFFGATKANILVASPNSLTVKVPSGATYQNISVTNLINNLTAYSAKPFITTFVGKIAFENKQDYVTGLTPKLLKVSDLDGDGKLDLVVVNEGNNSISIFRNTGFSSTISFAPKIDFKIDAKLTSLSIGDIDGDGKLDLAFTSQNSSHVSILRNTSVAGLVSFAPQIDISTGPYPYLVSICDIDGDGKFDLVVRNDQIFIGSDGENAVSSILYNTSTSGTINFASRRDFAVWFSELGDLDGDEKPDLISVGQVMRNTSVLGTLSFDKGVSYQTGPIRANVTVTSTDIDGDGKRDLVAVNETYQGGALSIYRNTSVSTTLSFAFGEIFYTGISPQSVAIGDINGDGKPDLAVVNRLSNTVSIFRNLSTPGTVNLAPKVDFSTLANPNSQWTFSFFSTIGDLDGDGKSDLVVSNSNTENISVYRQTIPQGGVAANGPLCESQIGKLTWTSNAGSGPYTIVYNDGVTNRTVTDVTNGIPFDVFTNPVPPKNTYSLVSVTYPDNSVQTTGFSKEEVDILVNPAPKASITGTTMVCKGDPPLNVVYTGSGGMPPYTFTYGANGWGNVKMTTTGMNTSISISHNTQTSGTFKYTLDGVSDANGCSRKLSEHVSISVSGQPKLDIDNYSISETTVYQAGKISIISKISNTDVRIKAEESIIFKPGFSATGNVFEAYIGGCNSK